MQRPDIFFNIAHFCFVGVIKLAYAVIFFEAMNDNGERLCDFGSANGLVITVTIFPHKEIHKLTWRSPVNQTVNQIDHVLVSVL